MVPGAFGINHGDGALEADAEAACFGAEDRVGGVGVGEAEFLDAFLEVFPGFDPGLAGAAAVLLGVNAEEEVPSAAACPDEVRGVLESGIGRRGRRRHGEAGGLCLLKGPG